MTYQEEKSKNFSKYCGEGKLALVKKWMNDKNVDINYNVNSPLRQAVRYNQIEVVKLLVSHSQLNTDYDRPRGEIKGGMIAANDSGINIMMNPFTIAMAKKNFEILDIFINKSNHPFKVKRMANLDVLLEMNDAELNTYFLGQPDFIDYVLSWGDAYLDILPPDLKDVFVF